MPANYLHGMVSILVSLFAAGILSTVALGVSFVVYRSSRLKGRLPARSFGSLYLLLLAGAWACTTWFRPDPPFAKETYWFPLAGLFVISGVIWMAAALSRFSDRTDALSPAGGAPSRSRRWGIPMPAGLYLSLLAILAVAALLGSLK